MSGKLRKDAHHYWSLLVKGVSTFENQSRQLLYQQTREEMPHNHVSRARESI